MYNSRMTHKLLALDIDGTVVREHTNTPSKRVIDAIRRANKKINITLISARAWKDQEIILNLLNLKDFYHVLENGTKVINPSGDLEYSKHIPAKEVQQIIDVSADFFDDIGFCIDSRWMKEYENPEEEIVSTLSLISFSRGKADKIPKLLKKLPEKYSVTVGVHWTNPKWAVTLISNKKASKGLGLRYIQKKVKITKEETIAVGDGASDVPTMSYAGVKIAMGNAEPELKRIADYIAPPVSEDGLVEIINKFVVGKYPDTMWLENSLKGSI